MPFGSELDDQICEPVIYQEIVSSIELTHQLLQWKDLPQQVQPGQVGGHEGVGIVAQLGPFCEHVDIKIGDRVGIKWIASACGNCGACLAGADGQCSNQKISGYTCPGTFQEFVVAPAHYVTPISDGLASEVVAPLLCGGVTTYSALKKSRAQAGDWVVVAGAGGGLGHLALQLGGRGMGFRMIALDVGSKENFAKSCGADIFINISKYPASDQGQGVTKEIMAITGNGASAVIICSGSTAAYSRGLGYLKFNGTMVCIGMPTEVTPIAQATPQLMVSKQLAIVGSTVGNRKEAIETLIMAERVVKTQCCLEKAHNLSRVFEEMKAGNLQGRVVLDLQSFTQPMWL